MVRCDVWLSVEKKCSLERPDPIFIGIKWSRIYYSQFSIHTNRNRKEFFFLNNTKKRGYCLYTYFNGENFFFENQNILHTQTSTTVGKDVLIDFKNQLLFTITIIVND